LLPFLKERGCMVEKGDFLDSVIKTLNTRSKTLIDMADGALFYFWEEVLYEEKAAKKFLEPASIEALKQLIDQLEPLKSFNENSLENAFKKVMEITGLKLGKIAQPVRVALTGKTVSPGIFEIIEVLGKKQVILRLQNAVRFIKDRKG
ncbi:MAG: glutamate--tRNA ligase, partial [Pseudomonadota bacterium]